MKPIYKISIVSAIYNTAQYLEEMIESIIGQDIGFEENVQLILVNDGSTDNSKEICLTYQVRYPHNIIYAENDHQGVSAARNTGLDYVRGEYVNFLDSDDKLDYSALRKAYNFFQENLDEIDLVAIPLCFFDKEQGEHTLNYKFITNRIIDIKEDYKSVQLSASSAFIKTDVINNYRFNTKLKYAEDADVVTRIILVKGKYGALSETKYYYRRRQDNSSTTQKNNTRDWYVEYIKRFSLGMTEKLNEIDVSYRKYVEYLIIYDLQWRINSLRQAREILEIKEYMEFINILIYIIKKVSRNIVMQQTNICFYRKAVLYLISFKKNVRIDRYMLKIISS